NEVRQNTTGSTGYKGTRNGRGAYGSLYRRTKSAIPVHEIKNQNIGAVKFTIDSNPLRPKEPTMIKKTAIKDCVSKAFIGLEVSDFQVRIKEKTGKSRPSAWLVRAPVKMVALVEVNAAKTTNKPIKKTPTSPIITRMASTPTASEAANPSIPSTLR